MKAIVVSIVLLICVYLMPQVFHYAVGKLAKKSPLANLYAAALLTDDVNSPARRTAAEKENAQLAFERNREISEGQAALLAWGHYWRCLLGF
jgi:hypothetical protein